MQNNRNEIEIEWVWLFGVSKHIGRFIVKLKAIKYKENFFYYLSSYPDLGLQAACLQILFFRLHAFRSFSLDCMPLKFSTKHICLNFGS